MHHRYSIALAIVLTLSLARPCLGGEPAADLKTHIDAVFSIVAEPRPADADKALERRREIRRIAETLFDFNEVAQRALAAHWAARTSDEQARFVRIFVDLIDRSYLTRVDQYGGERIMFLGQAVNRDDAIVRTEVVSKNDDRTPVDYLMRKDGERWRVYDVKVAGMSLVGSYRAQFNKIIQSSSYNELVKKLETRTAVAER